MEGEAEVGGEVMSSSVVTTPFCNSFLTRINTICKINITYYQALRKRKHVHVFCKMDNNNK